MRKQRQREWKVKCVAYEFTVTPLVKLGTRDGKMAACS